ncbi:multifunctional CCA addition/repair protein [Ahniella affigens]|uniref:Multifunctional CCA protein n=1 Tax=Ahniella affigens TaxID=2021234 RepID=A0A2P1PV80_9GAMM|nr:multifunctional CCA addition/repair protein [Ahniella affigens]AVP98730.1 multifunctional CCA addition/repair protein [Ahniella affigens]
MSSFQRFLVGGAVRDRLLNRPVKDRDWVVVGARVDDMLTQGFLPVGKDFPVFLHPDSKEEHALARTERKSAPGYRGFVISSDPDVTLEDDLRRRDLTINAIAEAEDGTLIDPYDGQRDLADRWLRHVSEAFVEDPVRVLRVARFAARYAPLGFRVAPETLALMQEMVRAGEVAHLVPERVLAELLRALVEPRPSAFLQVLRASGALRVIFPELDALYQVPQRIEFHPEYDTGVHLALALDAAARLAPGNVGVAFAVLLHDLGKAVTPADVLPKHLYHEQNGRPLVQAFNARFKVPTELARLAEHVCVDHLNVHRFGELRAGSILDLFERLDLFRRPKLLPDLLLACHADKAGRANMPDADYPSAAPMLATFTAAAAVQARPFVERGLQGEQIATAVRDERLRRIAETMRSHRLQA